MKKFDLKANILVMMNGTQHLVKGSVTSEHLVDDEGAETLAFMISNFKNMTELAVVDGPKQTVLTAIMLANSIPTFYLEEIK